MGTRAIARRRSGARKAPAQSRDTAPLRKSTRIQAKNRKAILDAALKAFSAYGFRGATIDQIASSAGLSKPNLLYYFPTKDAIYKAVLESTLETWLKPLAEIDPAGDPIEEISRYIEAKLEMSRARPEASKLFANEILHGAPAIGEFLRGPMKVLIDEKAAVIQAWIDAGKLAAIDPRHLIMMIWAVTQHYADFDVQVRAVLGESRSGSQGFSDAAAFLQGFFRRGLTEKR